MSTGEVINPAGTTTTTKTQDEFLVFTLNYLWFLMDQCKFVAGEVKMLMLFSKHKEFCVIGTRFMRGDIA
jgi:hypothetical protein